MHKVTRESDEYVCSCGLRWGTDEADPHSNQFIDNMAEAHKKINTDEYIEEMRKTIRNKDVSE